ncbi:MAG: hypothetical protein FWG65_13270 [Turicibacter sp.]|nr:hypothetical protein [Turicibacter sp.]
MTMQEYRTKLLQDTFEKRAEFTPNSQTQQECEICDEPIIFALATKNGENFSVGLTTILKCLKTAENEFHIPPIDSEFWLAIRNDYKLDLR